MTKRKIVCLCGSTEAHENYVEANLRETLKGNIVLSVGVFGHRDIEVHGRAIDLNQHKGELDRLHHDKVRMADEVLVVGRVGQSTQREIDLAGELGIPVRYFDREQPNGFQVKSSIPVLPMLDEAKSLEFYVEFLGYEVEWEHRFGESPDSPLYAQVRLGDSVLHLNGHADSDATVVEVRVPVQGLEAYCEKLQQKTPGAEKPEIVDPRYEGRPTDMNMIDPAGNTIVFWAP